MRRQDLTHGMHVAVRAPNNRWRTPEKYEVLSLEGWKDRGYRHDGKPIVLLHGEESIELPRNIRRTHMSENDTNILLRRVYDSGPGGVRIVPLRNIPSTWEQYEEEAAESLAIRARNEAAKREKEAHAEALWAEIEPLIKAAGLYAHRTLFSSTVQVDLDGFAALIRKAAS